MNRNPLRRYFRHGFLPQLIALEACVRTASVTRAAEELALAQPTVSCLLRKLAETVGAPVTRVRDRRVEATPEGERLLDLFRDIHAAFGRFEARAATERQGARYHPSPEHHPDLPCPSPSLPRRRSRWKQRASSCPHARPKPSATSGAS